MAHEGQNHPNDDGGRRLMHLGYMYWANGTHPAGWRYPGAEHDGAFEPDHIVRLARTAEAAKFDFFFFGDRLATGLNYELTNTSVLARFEPFTAASYLATRTKEIGIVVTANPTYYEPFNLARLVSSLDHVTHGRASWNIVTGADGRAAQNYSRSEHGDPDYRYDRADEFISIVRRLWDSWEDGAFIRDKKTGSFVDGDKIHSLNHVGKTFSVKGPLNVARAPQGHPVILHAGTSERSRNFGAGEADVIFAASATLEDGLAYANDMRRRARERGRPDGQIRILPGITPLIGKTREAARQIYDQLNALIILDDDVQFGGREPSYWSLDAKVGEIRGEAVGAGHRNLGALSQRVGIPLLHVGIDDLVDLERASAFNHAGSKLLAETERRTGRGIGQISWRDLLHTYIVGGHVVVGSADDIAGYFETWFKAEACDGFNVQSAYVYEQLDLFVELVVPELQRRGLFRTDYRGATLRDRFGLERPINHFAA
ncbi:NtaA/DmoA family FMN-dependent monooxygenase [Rhizobium puerariae]|uniref:NtaA/DmoA family FMN-dependent monooxygenase n=1 Tax=Rhizobium puerariae TaxID=1585791 RepID=A0ABV6APX0_9HYPH